MHLGTAPNLRWFRIWLGNNGENPAHWTYVYRQDQLHGLPRGTVLHVVDQYPRELQKDEFQSLLRVLGIQVKLHIAAH